MKRFFKPVEKDGPSKKPCSSSSSSSSPAPAGGVNAEASASKAEPLKFLTWNANSLLLRVKNNWAEFSKFIQTLDPDVIAIQEVRMPAAGSKGAPKNPSELKDDTSASREEKKMLLKALSAPPFGNYRVWWSLSDSKYGGTALFVKKEFQPKKVSFSLDRTGSKHEPDGRVILAEFKTFLLLNTYVPNNGWKEEENSFQRRRKWDKRVLDFVLNMDKPLIWCGDLNVSHQEIDVSHPDFFSNAKLNGYVPPNNEDCGQPGFTLAERRRFSNILSMGKLVDAYRFLHKEQDMECGFSWSGNPIGKYRGKRMRIDYFIVSEQLKGRVLACDIHGRGIELEGFYGSDHCPVTLELSSETSESIVTDGA
ncbi:DNA-(apurinic or apyrimidinic site) endonuclease [Dioscorea cayenensis subsp. rotundata]|uniref:DNA-(apurinic or apyrimidinic site) endonuclease n=1 Tax=Dioscorea cayennensis subsp. rotundata TaxID=55577 RepID=A0AB40D602_DIOCR|nr:DNA-(apurinic or apyrimidinic site) endonuclease [Dioscorea cayenensis subsp. rotundata]